MNGLTQRLMTAAWRFREDLGLIAENVWLPHPLFWELHDHINRIRTHAGHAYKDDAEIQLRTPAGFVTVTPHNGSAIEWSFSDRQPHPLEARE